MSTSTGQHDISANGNTSMVNTTVYWSQAWQWAGWLWCWSATSFVILYSTRTSDSPLIDTDCLEGNLVPLFPLSRDILSVPSHPA